MNQITEELAAALRNLLQQTYQMSGMFHDGDMTIANAVNDAEQALQAYQQSKHIP